MFVSKIFIINNKLLYLLLIIKMNISKRFIPNNKNNNEFYL